MTKWSFSVTMGKQQKNAKFGELRKTIEGHSLEKVGVTLNSWTVVPEAFIYLKKAAFAMVSYLRQLIQENMVYPTKAV